ncbi:hypothetical protein Cgig2_011564 [Carnegiea gigantea]|uniref:Uncharacterized protein n=1 Tax=Carnegiea gigantea TaxID=171969 RepID=A0A9Q1JMJ8_9CARY|nr:hypothetical protein Cgig2_011564 [Carnegiea gigantea]
MIQWLIRSWGTTKEKLKGYFGQYGDVMEANIIRDKALDRRRVLKQDMPVHEQTSPMSRDFTRYIRCAAEYYRLPELSQVIFYAMLLNEAERLGVLQGQRLRSLEVAITELHWSAFESWIWLFSDRVYEAQFSPKGGSRENTGASRQEESSGRGAADVDAGPERAASP